MIPEEEGRSGRSIPPDEPQAVTPEVTDGRAALLPTQSPPAGRSTPDSKGRRRAASSPQFSDRSPFYIGFTGGLGLLLAYLVYLMIVDVTTVLTLVGLALFIAMGLDPVVEWLARGRLPRSAAVLVVGVLFITFVVLFVAAAVPPISHEIKQLTNQLPEYRQQISSGQGWVGRLAVRLHVNTYVSNDSNGKGPLSPNVSWLGGILGAGKLIISALSGTLVVLVLSFYFMAALPTIRQLWLRCLPASKRQRGAAFTDAVLARVSGFVLGNLLTSLIAGVGTTVWLAAFHVPYAFLLGLTVAVLDLIPIIGSTVGGFIASLVALSRGLPIAIATAIFYTVYRFLEDHLLTPLVMRRTVRVSAGVTIIATLMGGALLGIIGALVAIPVAATIQLLLEEIAFPHLDQR
jgi:predicted PurR-regulated permease PerM